MISQYDHPTRTFTLSKLVDERGLELPNPDESAFHISVGDKYVILDIFLPQSYIDTAEAELLDRATDWLNKYSNEQVAYELDVDEFFVKQHNSTFPVGSKIRVIDNALGLDDLLRITECRRNLVSEYKYDVKISDTVYYGTPKSTNAQ